MQYNREYSEIAADVVAAQKGDAAAMERILNDVQDPVYYNCLRILRSETAAEDASQEILLQIYRKLKGLKNPGTYIAWVKSITANHCKNRLSRSNREIFLSPDEDGNDPFAMFEDVDEQKIPDKAFDNAETARMVLGLIDALPDEQRMCVMLHYYDQMKTREIADALDVSEGTVKSRLNYARKAIKEGVERFEKQQGVKLYGFTPIPFLTYYLTRLSAGRPSPVTAARVLRSVGSAASVGATSSAATATGAAGGVFASVGGRIAVGVLSVGLLAGIGFGVYKMISSGDIKKAPPAITEATPDPTDAPDTPVPATPEPAAAPEQTPEPTLVPATPEPTPEPTEEPVREVAILEKAKAKGTSVYLRNETFKDAEGNYYLSENTYTFSLCEPQNYLSIPLDMGYGKIAGSVCLINYRNDDSTVIFQIRGDGENLYELRFPERGKTIDYGLIPFEVDVTGVKELQIRFFSAHDRGETQIAKIGLSEVVATTISEEERAALPEKTVEKDDRVSLFDLNPSGVSMNRRAITANGIVYDSGNTYVVSDQSKPNKTVNVVIGGNYTRLTGSFAPMTTTMFYTRNTTLVFQIEADGEVLFEKTYPKSKDLDWSTVDFDLDVTGADKIVIRWMDMGDGIGSVVDMGFMDFLLTPKD